MPPLRAFAPNNTTTKKMTLTNEPVAAARTPLPDIDAWFGNLPPDGARTLRLLGELLAGTAKMSQNAETADRFTARSLGVEHEGRLIDEERELSAVAALTTGLALGEWIVKHAAEVGPGDHTHPPAYTQTEVGDTTYRHPRLLRAAFPVGTLLPEAACVVHVDLRGRFGSSPEVAVWVRREHQDAARTVLDRLAARATELNPYRSRACRASYNHGLDLAVIDLPATLSRDTVVVSPEVWREIELGVRAVGDHHKLLNAHGLGARRGVLLVGPPGVGKSAVSAAIANEVVGEFTVIYVEAEAGERVLTAVVEEAQRLGGPVLLVLEDVDLWCRDRGRGNSAGLSELLQAMDIAADARILTLASTNDSATLDKAAIRTGRFDSVVVVDYPNHIAAARILATLLDGIPGSTGVDTAAVAAALPNQTSGSDLREIVRRAVLTAGVESQLSTAALLAEVGSGRYRAELPGAGTYL